MTNHLTKLSFAAAVVVALHTAGDTVHADGFDQRPPHSTGEGSGPYEDPFGAYPHGFGQSAGTDSFGSQAPNPTHPGDPAGNNRNSRGVGESQGSPLSSQPPSSGRIGRAPESINPRTVASTSQSAGTGTGSEAPGSDRADDRRGPMTQAFQLIELKSTLSCRQDVDDSAMVDFGDLLAVLTGWGMCPAPPTTIFAEPEGCPADVNGDGLIGFSDLLEVLTHYGQHCSTIVVPED